MFMVGLESITLCLSVSLTLLIVITFSSYLGWTIIIFSVVSSLAATSLLLSLTDGLRGQGDDRCRLHFPLLSLRHDDLGR